jgi:hypothetical protein
LIGQTVHAVAPITFEYDPAVQLRHALALVASTATEYVPVVQFVHEVAPGTAYAPAAQDIGHTYVSK